MRALQTGSFIIMAIPSDGETPRDHACRLSKTPMPARPNMAAIGGGRRAPTGRIRRARRVDFPMRFRVNMNMPRNSTLRSGKRTTHPGLTLAAQIVDTLPPTDMTYIASDNL